MNYCLRRRRRRFVVNSNIENDEAVVLYNNIFLATGSAARRVILNEIDADFNSCYHSLFVDAGSGGSFILLHDNTLGDVTDISGDAGFKVGAGALNGTTAPTCYTNTYKSGISGLFVSYGGSDGNYRTLMDNNWRLSASAPSAALTGANTNQKTCFVDDFYGYDREQDSTWSMGACEYP